MEMKAQARRLSGTGKCAVFIPIEELADQDIDAVLEPADRRALATWKATDGEHAWIFLDAVDELKLNAGKLGRALRRVATCIDGYSHRAHVVVSCRPSDWRFATHLATMRELLPVPISATPTPPPADEVFLAGLRERPREAQGDERKDRSDVRVVALRGLSSSQIQAFARHAGIVNVDAFLAEIRNQDAWHFARRPLDLSELVNTWTQRKRLGTLLEQHEANVASRLRDDPSRPNQDVSDTQLREGAERLALGLALTRRRAIRIADPGGEVGGGPAALDATAILPDWTEAARQTLLRPPPLFDPAQRTAVCASTVITADYLPPVVCGRSGSAACQLGRCSDFSLPRRTA